MAFELDTLSYTLLATIVGTAALLSARNSKTSDIHPLLLNTQSDVSRLRYPGESAIYRSRMYPTSTPLCSTFERSIRTLADFYKAGGIKKHSNTEFLKQDNGYATYEKIGQKSQFVYQGLRVLSKLVPQSKDENSFVGIYALNSYYTVLTEIACHMHGLVTVPVSAHASSSHLSNVLEKTSLKVLIVDSSLLQVVLNTASNNSSLKHIVIIGDISDLHKKEAQNAGIELISFTDLEKKGENEKYDDIQVAPNDVASIYFNSAGEKESKHGVVLTQKNLLSSISSYLLTIPPQQKITTKDRLMLNLPIDNVLGHVLTAAVSFLGGSVVFGPEINGSDNIDVAAHLSLVAKNKPTIFARQVNKSNKKKNENDTWFCSGSWFLKQVKQLIESYYGKSFLFKRGYDVKKEYLKEGRLVGDCKYDTLVFRSAHQNLFGGNLRLIYIDNDDNTDLELTTFLRIVLSTQVIQTFSLPETTSTIVASMFYDYNTAPEARGAPLPCNEVKLVDLQERSLTAEDKPNPRGEIWVRGNNVFSGYYKDEQATSDVLDSDGWFTTGYLGEILPNGALKVLEKK
ncbi:hypothetical protein G6F16_010919 [Rhizopus arrhizus]|uniref:AMP-dependent synthetase/ligase domain-containing protein n=1 Tax=Rhizopus oryzae TaxID=64495 RepID=A0A9P6X154_RHIOR|nr:hypothetical protein G6F23_010447 [Rhizopus arrhizus]KAG0757386.1 hypothetical protein G6F24_010516 [Rhizopus arrhizus]KAG0783480.1 hypothetical protein G6F21_010508 [Rhizopus arrhizus]KAG0808800.1 hypothetical protein G6F20_009280 [Rhizopus arrhizus]KAG0823354.1 hypothetical protein G6F19_010900 [Rhizopus arrhizus]